MEEPQLVWYQIGGGVAGERGTEGGNAPRVQEKVAPGFYERIADLRGYLAWEQKWRKGSAGNTALWAESWVVLG